MIPPLATNLSAFLLTLALVSRGAAADQPGPAPLNAAGIHGGLCIQIGGDETLAAQALAPTGRFLVALLAADDAAAAALRQCLQAQESYGLVSVDVLPPDGRLPYTENLANLVIVAPPGDLRAPLAEIARALCPGSALLAPAGRFTSDELRATGFSAAPAGGWLVARKAWPREMDEWSHPRHAADGNPVSDDALAGPPRRIRWVAGPEREISSMVTAAGRNFYGGVWARDSFNGLRLWQRELTPSPAQGGFSFNRTRGSLPPIAAGPRLIAWADDQLAALDGATGAVVIRYPEAGRPSEVFVADDTLLAIDAESVRALELDSGRLRWTHTAAEPRSVVAGGGAVFLLEGAARKGEPTAVSALELASGAVRWRTTELPELAQVRRTMCHEGLLVLEVSTLADTKEGNAIHVVSAADGKLRWSRAYVPGMQHMKQARAMFADGLVWVLEDHKFVGLDPATGEERRAWKAGWCHCFPPIATARYLLAGEMELTDLATGDYIANHLTKANCSRDSGWVPANGLLYVTPKHCVCWPMLRGYAAMAPADPAAQDPRNYEPVIEPGVAPPSPPAAAADDWPIYRRDAWRSAATPITLTDNLQLAWSVSLGGWPEGPIADDWRENPFIHGPVTPPVVAGGLVYVARPDAHEVVALDAATGAVRWRFTANGRVDTPPTIHAGLCLFGTKSGWVYCLRADDGRVVWRLRAAPSDERMVAYGQVESPWPVPGSVLVVDGTAYFAAGRQSLADGGIHVYAVEPTSGRVVWHKLLDTLPTKNFYGSSGLEFDNFDLMHQEGASVAMSRWLFDRKSGEMTCKADEAFAVLGDEAGGAVVPRGSWSYAPRHQPRHGGERYSVRPLVAFRGNTLIAAREDFHTLFRRDFHLDAGEQFDRTWMTGWDASEHFRDKAGEVYRSDRLAQGAAWSTALFDQEPAPAIAALLIAADKACVASSTGRLAVISLADGQLLRQLEVAPPVWDGLAASAGRLYLTTQSGAILSLAP